MENNCDNLQIQYRCAKEENISGSSGVVAFSPFSADYNDCATRCARRTTVKIKVLWLFAN
uniref:Uncharacterized protein n=1 Tax=Glossina pallidipes TaxID=7398 RepID=A0A1A9ZSQ0_GLOPL